MNTTDKTLWHEIEGRLVKITYRDNVANDIIGVAIRLVKAPIEDSAITTITDENEIDEYYDRKFPDMIDIATETGVGQISNIRVEARQIEFLSKEEELIFKLEHNIT